MAELNLLESFPNVKRIIEKGWRTQKNRDIAKLYGQDFFDGDRVNGYGGYYYDGRWKNVVRKLQQVYSIDSNSSVLDIGCAKGFLLYDLQDMIPGIKVAGLDVSKYAIDKSMEGYSKYLIKQGVEEQEALQLEQIAKNKVLPHSLIHSAEQLPWANNSFDVVLAINILHNLPQDKFKNAIKEMQRVCKPDGHKFIQVDSYKTEEDLERMNHWILTAETFLNVDKLLEFYKECDYNGDYYWTIF